MAIAGYNVTIKESGTSTAFTGQACTNTSGKSYQLPAAYRVLDPDTTPTVYDDGSPVDSADILSIDYLQGIVTFTGGYTVIGAITSDGDYYPMFTVAEARSMDFQRMRDMLETTIFGQSYKSRIAGLADASLTVESIDGGTATDIDTGGTTQSWQAPWASGAPVVLEVGTTGKTFRFWAVEESISNSSSVADLVTASIGFQLAAYIAADGTVVDIASF